MSLLAQILRGRFVLGASVLLGLVLGVVAHERLRVNGNGAPLFWTTPSNIGIVIQSGPFAPMTRQRCCWLERSNWTVSKRTNTSERRVLSRKPSQGKYSGWWMDTVVMTLPYRMSSTTVRRQATVRSMSSVVTAPCMGRVAWRGRMLSATGTSGGRAAHSA